MSCCVIDCNEEAETIVIPSTHNGRAVTEIGPEVFDNCTKLTSVIIPDSVNRVDERMFYGCTALTEVVISNNLSRIGWAWFGNCSSLETIIIPNSVTKIDESAFEICTSLTSVFIPESVTEISSDSFFGCTALTIYGFAGSYAQSYANKYIIPFVEIGTVISSSLRILNRIITGISVGDTVTQVLAKCWNDSSRLKAFDADGVQLTDTSVRACTGMVIKLYNDTGDEIDTVTAAVRGDVSGDGVIDAIDAATAELAMNTHATLDGVYKSAADTDGNDVIDINDFSALQNASVGLTEL
ncbi:MAG: leucine-rich repeat protein [Clostridiales bacterium]|nr:leucine-rich repeat protein [Clostridiales bacterium]